MTCAKKRVFCTIITEGGNVYVGENWCRTPQLFCPREPGEGLEKCKTICNQPNHAEIDALNKAIKSGRRVKGSIAVVKGITWMCRNCQETLIKAGVQNFRVEP